MNDFFRYSDVNNLNKRDVYNMKIIIKEGSRKAVIIDNSVEVTLNE